MSKDSDTERVLDARLDNRTGADRPKVEEFPAKPQQIDGPDIIHQAEATQAEIERRVEAADGDATDGKGMFSPGPHGLSDPSVRENDEPVFGTEGLKAE